MRTRIFFLLSLVLVWIALAGIYSILMAICCVIMSYIFASILGILPKSIKINCKFVPYLFWLLWEIMKSGIAVMKIIWRKELVINPTFEWVHSHQQDDIGLMLYGNSITLTPGTVTFDVKDNMLLVHALDQSSIDDLKTGEMDYRVRKIIS